MTCQKERFGSEQGINVVFGSNTITVGAYFDRNMISYANVLWCHYLNLAISRILPYLAAEAYF